MLQIHQLQEKLVATKRHESKLAAQMATDMASKAREALHLKSELAHAQEQLRLCRIEGHKLREYL